MTVVISGIEINEKKMGDSREIVARFQEHEDYVTDIAIFSCDNENLAFISGSTDKTVRMSDYKWKH